MTDLEIKEDAARVRVSRDVVNIVNERTPTWAHVLTVCLVIYSIAMIVKAVTA